VLKCSFFNSSFFCAGAKDAHKVSPHFAQLLYFGLISAAAMAPVHFQPSNFGILIQEFLRPQFWVLGGIGSGAAFVFVHYFSLAHPYLLADNRHYTFYLWKDVIQRNQSAKYCLIPLYVYSWWSILHSLGEIPPSCCRILVSPNQLSLLLKLLQSFLYLLGLGLTLFPCSLVCCSM
jgi:alpha-1,2-glucosyltransferase